VTDSELIPTGVKGVSMGQKSVGRERMSVGAPGAWFELSRMLGVSG
jgi:hypothetical protein